MVGAVSYRSVLTLHFNTDGFFIEVMPFFSVGHPRLFISWSEVSERIPSRALWWNGERLSISHWAISTITLPAKLLAQHRALN